MKNITLRFIYLYLFAAVGLIIVVIGLIQGVNLALKSTLFPEVDKYQMFYPTYPSGEVKLSTEEIAKQKEEFDKNQIVESNRNKQRELANTIAMIVVGLPLYVFHWKMIQKEHAQG